MEIIKLENYCFSYEQEEKNVLNNINLIIKDSEIMVMCGESSSGKTTLLRSIKKETAPVGKATGKLKVNIRSREIGFVFQNTEIQIISNNVLYNLFFHMENIGIANITMKKRIAETVSYFGLEATLEENASNLSGGQKQLIALASELITHPKLLLLDEPLSQLDPLSARNLIGMLKKVNEELGIAIIITEHNIDELITIADKIVLMSKGSITYKGTPENTIKDIWRKKDQITSAYIPTIPLCSLTLQENAPISLTAKELKNSIKEIPSGAKNYAPAPKSKKAREKKITMKKLYYIYEEGKKYTIQNLALEINTGEIISILGGNGAGKTTLLKLIAKILIPQQGEIKIKAKKIAYIPQNITAYFYYDTVEKEIHNSINKNTKKEYTNEIIEKLELEALYKKHPYDLSGGEQQKLAIGSALLNAPEIILLDEPTKGVDPNLKKTIIKLIRDTKSTTIIATHDIELAAQISTRCLLLFNGDIAADAPPIEFFKNNKFYTTPINKALSHINENILDYKDVLELWQKEKPSFIQ